MLTIERPLDLRAAEQRRGLLGPRGAFVGGGTALQLSWRGATPPLTLIDVSRLPETQGVALSGRFLRIGAATRLETLRRDPIAIVHAPLLVEACAQLAALAVRHLATLGGNVGWGHGDTLPVLLAGQADAELAGGRCVPLAGLLERAELPLIVALRLAISPAPALRVYEKIGHRAAFSPTRLALALCAGFDAQGRPQAPKLAASGAGLRARRLIEAERLLGGAAVQPIPRDRLREACAHDLDGDRALARIACAVIAGSLEAAQP